MSEEIQETKKVHTVMDDYEKAKKHFNSDEYSKEEFLTLARLYSESLKMLKRAN